MTEVTQAVPFAAWEQAVFVVLLIVLVAWVLSWVTKQNREWQNFIAKIEEQWRTFSREQRNENNACMADVNKSLGDLTQVTGKLVQTVDEMRADIYQHDVQAKEIKALVEQNGKPAPKPRVKKEQPSD